MVADFNNLLSFPSTLAEGAARLAHSSAESNRLLQYFPGTIASFLNYSDEIYRSKFIQDLSASTTTASFILNFISLGVNTNLAIEAKNDRQRSLAITRIAFDSVSFLFSIWSWRAMLATEGFSPLLTVIAAGYGLAWISEKISNFLDENIDNITLTQNIGNFFNQLKKGFERGGFNLINNELLAPV
ncbi:hypothetical protein Rin_00010970 [Candidatus Regiella insecticola 5.15]|uniref:Uncharacterized protein n=1 Tax=Candidatus Regiella insecticola 5.15 TaxID=1005043 RepID=G2GZ82_9ENTR|nr:hypothetical protein Rin_00010970 [Candidatus Regiella insecticola 5.15]